MGLGRGAIKITPPRPGRSAGVRVSPGSLVSFRRPRAKRSVWTDRAREGERREKAVRPKSGVEWWQRKAHQRASGRVRVCDVLKPGETRGFKSSQSRATGKLRRVGWSAATGIISDALEFHPPTCIPRAPLAFPPPPSLQGWFSVTGMSQAWLNGFGNSASN
jgi:hypothetical protein